MGTCLASLAPISSWVGLEIGYVSALYSQLGGTWASLDPFVGLMQAPFIKREDAAPGLHSEWIEIIARLVRVRGRAGSGRPVG